MKRFYKTVTAGPVEGGHTVLLDDRPVRTPRKKTLVLPAPGLATLVVAEWDAQAETIEPDSMPVTKLCTSVVDLFPERRDDAEAELIAFADTDLLCYRAPSPRELAERQAELWQPWLDWAARELGASLRTTTGIEPIPQPPSAIEALARAIADTPSWPLIALHAATKLTGSLVLGLAVARGKLAAEAAFTAAELETLYELERWGEEEEQRRRHAALRRDLLAACRFIAALDA